MLHNHSKIMKIFQTDYRQSVKRQSPLLRMKNAHVYVLTYVMILENKKRKGEISYSTQILPVPLPEVT